MRTGPGDKRVSELAELQRSLHDTVAAEGQSAHLTFESPWDERKILLRSVIGPQPHVGKTDVSIEIEVTHNRSSPIPLYHKGPNDLEAIVFRQEIMRGPTGSSAMGERVSVAANAQTACRHRDDHPTENPDSLRDFAQVEIYSACLEA